MHVPHAQVPAVVQIAALMGVGLLYQGSAHRLMSEVRFGEIARPPAMPPHAAHASPCWPCLPMLAMPPHAGHASPCCMATPPTPTHAAMPPAPLTPAPAAPAGDARRDRPPTDQRAPRLPGVVLTHRGARARDARARTRLRGGGTRGPAARGQIRQLHARQGAHAAVGAVVRVRQLRPRAARRAACRLALLPHSRGSAGERRRHRRRRDTRAGARLPQVEQRLGRRPVPRPLHHVR